VPDTEGALQDESVEMVPEHVVLKDDGMYNLHISYAAIYVCVCNIFTYYGLNIYIVTRQWRIEWHRISHINVKSTSGDDFV